MKYLFILFIGLVACKKNYTCECTSTLTMQSTGYVRVDNTSNELKNVSKKRAEELCYDYVKTSNQIPNEVITETVDCKLK